MNTHTFQAHVQDTFGMPPAKYSCVVQPSTIEHGVVGIASEAGELLQILRKSGYEGQQLSIDEVVEELGDVLRYCAVLLNSLDLTFEEVFSANACKIDSRRQPTNISAMRALVENPPGDYDK